MNATTELLERNKRFSQNGLAELSFLPRLRTCIVTCPDSRVDPAHVLGIELVERRAPLRDGAVA